MSLNRDKQFAPLLPKEEVEKQKLYSESLSKPKPGKDALRDRRVNPLVWVILGVLVLAAAIVLAVHLYRIQPIYGETMELELYCVKVDIYGKIVDRGTVNLQGQFVQYRGVKDEEFWAEPYQIMDKSRNGGHWTCVRTPDGRLLLGNSIEVGPDRDWIVVVSGPPRGTWIDYYICSTQEDFDPAEIAQKSSYIPDEIASKIKP